MLIANLVIGMSANTTRLQKGMTRSQRLVKGLVRGLGAVLAVQGFIKIAKDTEAFNSAMTKSLSIMSGVNEKIRRDMKATAQDVAFNTQFSAAQAAESYFFLASAGLSAEQSLAALPRVAEFAQAGNFDMALATDLLTDAQSALGLTVDDTAENMENMTRVSDVLAKANTQANATIQQFSEALTQKAGVALRNLGKDIEEGVAVLAVFADQGLKGAEAGTALNIVFRDLEQSATKNAGAFDAAGVAVFDAQGEMRNMADIVEDLEGALAGASDEQRTLTLAALGFPAKSQAFIKALLGSSDAIRDYEATLRDAAGTTKDISDKMLTPWQKAMNKMGAAIGKLMDVFLAPLINVLAEVIGWIADFIKFIADAAAKVRDFLFATGDSAAIDKATDAMNENKKATQEWGDALSDTTGEIEKEVSAVDKMIAALNEERDKFGLSSRELSIRSARLAEATEEELAMIRGIHNEIEALKLAEEQTKKNSERLREQAEEAREFASAFRSLTGPSGQLTAGGALTVVHQIQRSTMPVPRGRDTGKQTVAELERQTRLLRNIERQIQQRPQVAVL